MGEPATNIAVRIGSWFAIGIILIALAGAFYLFSIFQAERRRGDQQGLAMPSASQPVSISEPTGTGVQRDGWKMYESALYKYSISRPPDWLLREVPNVTFMSPDIRISSAGRVSAGGQVVIFVSDYPVNKPVQDFYNSFTATDFRIVERQHLRIGGLPALRYVAEAPGVDWTMTGAIVAASDNLYRLESYYGRADRDRIVNVFDLMVASIRFAAQ